MEMSLDSEADTVPLEYAALVSLISKSFNKRFDDLERRINDRFGRLEGDRYGKEDHVIFTLPNPSPDIKQSRDALSSIHASGRSPTGSDDFPRTEPRPQMVPKYWAQPNLENLPGCPTIATATITECTARWKTFTVAALYEFLNEVAEYEHAHRVVINHIPLISRALLDYLSRQEGAPSKNYAHWQHFELKKATMLALSASRPTSLQLCEIAQRVVKYPRVMASATASETDKALAQLNQVPLFLSRLDHFRRFVDEYIGVSWPAERNANEARVHRLNEVAEAAVKAHAPVAWNIIKTDFYDLRKKRFQELCDGLTRTCRERVATLASAAEVWEKLVKIPLASALGAAMESASPSYPRRSHNLHNMEKEPLEADETMFTAVGPADIPDQKNFAVPTETVEPTSPFAPPPLAIRPLGGPLDDVEYDVEETARDGLNMLNAMDTKNTAVAKTPAVDPKTLPCNQELIRGVGSCKRGADCPFSHDQALLKAAWVEVYNRLYRK